MIRISELEVNMDLNRDKEELERSLNALTGRIVAIIPRIDTGFLLDTRVTSLWVIEEVSK